MARIVVLFPTVLLLVSGCGEGPPTPVRSHLPLADGVSRLLERSSQRTDLATAEVDVPAGATHLQLRADCRGNGEDVLHIEVSGQGGGGFQCHRRSGGGLVDLGGDFTDQASGGPRTVTVSSSPGVTWTAAVDAG